MFWGHVPLDGVCMVDFLPFSRGVECSTTAESCLTAAYFFFFGVYCCTIIYCLSPLYFLSVILIFGFGLEYNASEKGWAYIRRSGYKLRACVGASAGGCTLLSCFISYHFFSLRTILQFPQFLSCHFAFLLFLTYVCFSKPFTFLGLALRAAVMQAVPSPEDRQAGTRSLQLGWPTCMSRQHLLVHDPPRLLEHAVCLQPISLFFGCFLHWKHTQFSAGTNIKLWIDTCGPCGNCAHTFSWLC